jgi:hypothetical protein
MVFEEVQPSARELDPQGLGETVARGRGNDRTGEGCEGRSSSLTTSRLAERRRSGLSVRFVSNNIEDFRPLNQRQNFPWKTP